MAQLVYKSSDSVQYAHTWDAKKLYGGRGLELCNISSSTGGQYSTYSNEIIIFCEYNEWRPDTNDVA